MASPNAGRRYPQDSDLAASTPRALISCLGRKVLPAAPPERSSKNILHVLLLCFLSFLSFTLRQVSYSSRRCCLNKFSRSFPLLRPFPLSSLRPPVPTF